MTTAILLRLSQNSTNDKAPPFILLNKDKIRIGRKSEVRMDTSRTQEISKKHALILRKTHSFGDSWTIFDSNSLNGTFVNGRKIDRCLLANGSEVVFGGGPEFLTGDLFTNYQSAECRYLFLIVPQTITFVEQLDIYQLDDNINVFSEPKHFPSSTIKTIRSESNVKNITIDNSVRNNSFKDEDNLVANIKSGNNNTDDDINMRSLSCSICFDPLIRFHMLPCRHCFCAACLNQWINTCYENWQPCTCPLCRKVFTQSQVLKDDTVVNPNEIFVFTILPLMEIVGIERKDTFKKLAVFKKWTDEEKDKYWECFNKVRKSFTYRLIFLHLTRMTVQQLFEATIEELIIATHNFDISVKTETKNDVLFALLRYLFMNLSHQEGSGKLKHIFLTTEKKIISSSK